jgi:hypothetical protein
MAWLADMVPSAQASTVGAAFLTKTIPELNVKFEIWCGCRAARMLETCEIDMNVQGHSWSGTVPQSCTYVLQVILDLCCCRAVAAALLLPRCCCRSTRTHGSLPYL